MGIIIIVGIEDLDLLVRSLVTWGGWTMGPCRTFQGEGSKNQVEIAMNKDGGKKKEYGNDTPGFEFEGA